MWQQWANGILGLWVILVPFLGFTAEVTMWVLVVTGVVIAVLGFWGGGEQVTVEKHQHA